MADGETAIRAGKYDLLEPLGRGAMGEVWKARDREVDRIVALKLLKQTEEEDLIRFRREAHLVAQLNHPNIAQLFEFGMLPPHISMQYVEGVPLTAYVIDGDRREILRARVQALRDAALGVQYAHERGIIHRDLKPGNILVDHDGRAFVLDFGLAREVKEHPTSITLQGDILGTPSYMAPEQARGDNLHTDARSDVYGLGSTLYTLISGRAPHTGPTPYDIVHKVVHDEPTRPGGDRDLETLCLKAIDKDPTRRYPTARAFIDDLDRWLRGDAIEARPPSVAYRLVKSMRRRPAVWALSTLLVLVSIAAAAVGLTLLVRANEELQGRLDAEERLVDDLRSRREAQPYLDAGRRLIRRLEELQHYHDIDPAEETIAREGLGLLAQALERYRDMPEAHLEMGRLHRLRGREDEALAALDAAIDLSPSLAFARLERARLRMGRYEARRHAITGEALAEDPVAAELRAFIEEDIRAVREWSDEFGDLKHSEGLFAFAQGDYAAAASALREYLAWNPVDAEAWYWYGHAAYHVEVTPETIAAFDRAIDMRPRLIEAYFLRGSCRRALGDARGAVEDFTFYLQHEDSHVAYNNRGNAYNALGEYAPAMEDFRRALRHDPHHAESWNGLGVALRGLRRHEEAIEAYDAAIENRPDFAIALNNRGLAYTDIGRPARGIEDFNVAIGLEPEYAMAYGNRGLAWAELGDHERALADYAVAVRLDGGNATHLNNRGMSLAALGRTAEAEAAYREAIRLNDGYAKAHLNLGNLLIDMGRTQDAIAAYTDAIERDREYVKAYSNRGLAYEQVGRTSEALADYNEAIRLDGRYANAWANRGLMRARTGDLRGAAEDLRRSLSLARPDWSRRPEIEQALRQVEARLQEEEF